MDDSRSPIQDMVKAFHAGTILSQKICTASRVSHASYSRDALETAMCLEKSLVQSENGIKDAYAQNLADFGQLYINVLVADHPLTNRLQALTINLMTQVRGLQDYLDSPSTFDLGSIPYLKRESERCCKETLGMLNKTRDRIIELSYRPFINPQEALGMEGNSRRPRGSFSNTTQGQEMGRGMAGRGNGIEGRGMEGSGPPPIPPKAKSRSKRSIDATIRRHSEEARNKNLAVPVVKEVPASSVSGQESEEGQTRFGGVTAVPPQPLKQRRDTSNPPPPPKFIPMEEVHSQIIYRGASPHPTLRQNVVQKSVAKEEKEEGARFSFAAEGQDIIAIKKKDDGGDEEKEGKEAFIPKTEVLQRLSANDDFLARRRTSRLNFIMGKHGELRGHRTNLSQSSTLSQESTLRAVEEPEVEGADEKEMRVERASSPVDTLPSYSETASHFTPPPPPPEPATLSADDKEMQVEARSHMQLPPLPPTPNPQRPLSPSAPSPSSKEMLIQISPPTSHSPHHSAPSSPLPTPLSDEEYSRLAEELETSVEVSPQGSTLNLSHQTDMDAEISDPDPEEDTLRATHDYRRISAHSAKSAHSHVSREKTKSSVGSSSRQPSLTSHSTVSPRSSSGSMAISPCSSVSRGDIVGASEAKSSTQHIEKSEKKEKSKSKSKSKDKGKKKTSTPKVEPEVEQEEDPPVLWKGKGKGHAKSGSMGGSRPRLDRARTKSSELGFGLSDAPPSTSPLPSSSSKRENKGEEKGKPTSADVATEDISKLASTLKLPDFAPNGVGVGGTNESATSTNNTMYRKSSVGEGPSGLIPICIQSNAMGSSPIRSNTIRSNVARSNTVRSNMGSLNTLGSNRMGSIGSNRLSVYSSSTAPFSPISPLDYVESGPMRIDSSFYKFGGFCEGARLMGDTGGGREGYRVVRMPHVRTHYRLSSKDKLFRMGVVDEAGERDGNGRIEEEDENEVSEVHRETDERKQGNFNATTAAKCVKCAYQVPMAKFEKDRGVADKSGIYSTVEGIRYRSCFLSKCHLATKAGDEAIYGCPFCIEENRTTTPHDATVFYSIPSFMSHLSRHPRPVPPVDGLKIIYGLSPSIINVKETPTDTSPHPGSLILPPEPHPGSPVLPGCDESLVHTLSNTSVTKPVDFDIYFVELNAKPSPLGDISLKIATRPSAQAVLAHRPGNPGYKSVDPEGNATLQFAQGAHIVGITFPTRFGGNWCGGYHDGSKGMFPASFIQLNVPDPEDVVMNPRSMLVATSRWEFKGNGEKSKSGKGKGMSGEGWLTFGKKERITHIGFPYAEHWCYSGQSSKGVFGLFPAAFVENLQEVERSEMGAASSASRKFSGLSGGSLESSFSLLSNLRSTQNEERSESRASGRDSGDGRAVGRPLSPLGNHHNMGSLGENLNHVREGARGALRALTRVGTNLPMRFSRRSEAGAGGGGRGARNPGRMSVSSSSSFGPD